MTDNHDQNGLLRSGDPASASWAEAAVVRALSQPPAVNIPPDFAARVTHHVLAQPAAAPRRWIGWGPRLAMGSGAVLTAAMFAVAPHASPSLSNFAFDTELVLLAELSALLLFSHRLLSRD